MILIQATQAVQPVNYWAIALPVLISFVGAIVSVIISTRSNARLKQIELSNSQKLKEVEFIYDYRKYILDKRKKVYDRAEILLSEHLDSDPIVDFLGTATTEKYNKLTDIRKKIWEVNSYSVWIGFELLKTLNRLDNFLFMLHRKIDDEKFSQPHDRAIDPTIMEKYYTIMRSLKKVYFEDLTKLDDIDTFINEKTTEHIKSLE